MENLTNSPYLLAAAIAVFLVCAFFLAAQLFKIIKDSSKSSYKPNIGASNPSFKAAKAAAAREREMNEKEQDADN